MYRQWIKFSFLLAMSICLSSSPVLGQSPADDEDVSRVIKLRSNDPPQAPSPSAKEETPPPAERVARHQDQLPDPTQIQFVEINKAAPASTRNTRAQQAEVETKTQPVVDQKFSLPQSKIGIPTTQASRRIESSPTIISSIGPQFTTKIATANNVNIFEKALVNIQLQNVSRQAAPNVKLIATLPAHARFVGSQPKPTRVDGQNYEFILSDINPRQIQLVELQIIPTEKRPLEIGTQIQITDKKTVAVGVRQPEIKMMITGPETAITGQWVNHTLIVENTGDGLATEIQLASQLPGQLHFEQGTNDHTIPKLRPGEKLELPVKMFCESPGRTQIGFNFAGKHIENRSVNHAINVLKPELEISAAGPNMTFVKRDGIYAIQIENTGEIDVTDVEVSFHVPAGFEVTKISREAKVDAKTGSLIWNVGSIPVNSHQTIQLKAIANSPGKQICKLEVRSNETKAKQIELITDVATRADVSIQLQNGGGPVEVGGTTEFVMNLSNRGSSVADDVQVHVELAPSLMPVKNENYEVSEVDNTIHFAASSIGPGSNLELRFQAVGVTIGEHVVRGVVMFGQTQRRLIAEDSVYVFETDRSRVSESLQPAIRRK